MAQYQDTTGDLVNSIKSNTKRYLDVFCSVIDSLMPQPTKDLSAKDDVLDVIMHQRRERNTENEEAGQAMFPPALLRRYNLYFRPLKADVDKPLAVREVRGAHCGKLISVRGIVTRISEVKPLLLVNAFSCDMCGAEVFQDVSDKTITPLDHCPSEDCKANGVRGQLHMQTRACKFAPFQEAKIQEMVCVSLCVYIVYKLTP